MNIVKRFGIYLWVVILVVVDQLTKLAVVNNMKNSSVTIIKGILKFTYCENKGVAFSIGEGHTLVFVIVNLLLIGAMVFYLERNRKVYNNVDKMFFIMVISGGLSNVIDRIARGFVVDFIDVNELFNFAIFNVADIMIVIGIICIAISYILKTVKNSKES